MASVCLQIISRKDAIQFGLKKYFTGKPCKHGHLCERRLSDGCIECSRLKVKAQDHRHYQSTKEYKKKKRLRYLKNRQIELARRKIYRENNKELEFIRRSLERLNSGVNFGSTNYEELLGFTKEDLRDEIATKFTEGMTWENYGEWHIDHIKPIKVFLDEGIFDPSKVNALTNLQPLWAKDNWSKGCKFNE